MLKKVILPDSVTEIDSHAFYECSGLLEFNLNKVVTVYESAFANCTALKSVNFGAVEYVKQAAFQGCTSLGYNRFASDTTSESEEALTIKLPSSVKEIGKGAFKGCSSVKYFNIKETQVTLIDNSVFADCLALVKITINDGSIVRAGAFINCTELAIDTDSDGKDDSFNVVGTYTAEVGAFDTLS
ncbi:MAG: leucine-rich repeat domain-containing protein, partial [Clostridia bacterium]|nr:leucine-rich repeat domain-containing protein [Clostridia bacterium]